MKYTIKQYAQAIFEALKDKPEKAQKEITERLLKLLVKNGDWKRHVAILKALEKLILKEKGLKKVFAEAPQEIPVVLKSEIENIFGGKIYFLQKINHSLLGGIKILVDEEILVDASAKKQLDNMFRGKLLGNKIS